MTEARREARRNHIPIKVWVTPKEKIGIEDNAKKCNLSTSKFLRNLGLNYTPKSTIDADSVLEIMQLNGDLGRLGGLLKMWLTNDESFSEKIQKIDVVHTLNEINSLREQIRIKINNL